MNNLQHIIEGNWDEVKGRVQKQWGKLTNNQMDEISGSYRKLKGKLQELYGIKSAEAEAEIADFFNSSDFDHLRQKAYNKINEIKEVVVSTLEEYFQAAKEKSINAEKMVDEYVTNNPYKVMGIAAAAGLLLGYLCKNRS